MGVDKTEEMWSLYGKRERERGRERGDFGRIVCGEVGFNDRRTWPWDLSLE